MRHVYFSFHYADSWKVNQIRNSGIVFGAKSVGFIDASLWEEARLKSKAALEALIEDALVGTTATVVLIGAETSKRPWVKHEIKRSVAVGNALLGLRLHGVKDTGGRKTKLGRVPYLLTKHGAPVHDWTNAKDLGDWVEAAWRSKNPPSSVIESIKRLFI